MKKLILACLLALGFVGGALASAGGIAWDRFPTDKLTDMAFAAKRRASCSSTTA